MDDDLYVTGTLVWYYYICPREVWLMARHLTPDLYWVQNSVFEGEVSEASFKKLKMELAHIIRDDEDSVILYTFRTTRYSKRETMGLKKGGDDNII